MSLAEIDAIEEILGHHFAAPDWLDRALTHRSHRQTEEGADNERLEFLGDRVLGLIASERLYQSFPDWDSGQLSRGLARVVSGESICKAAQRLQLGSFLRLGAGEEKTGGREKKRLLADAYEAVVGAIYLDAGMEAAVSFLLRTLIDPALEAEKEGPERLDHKSALQEWLQRRGLGIIEYRLLAESGPDHQKIFQVEAWHAGKELSEAAGRSKKDAEQAAARIALEILEGSEAAPELGRETGE